jgi:hypothetical protein
VGLGDAVLVIVRAAVLPLATTALAVALLLVRFGTMFDAVAVSVSEIFVPPGVLAFTCNATVKLATPFTARLVLSVQVIVPVAPTAGVVQVQPVGIVIDWKFVLGGVVSLKVAAAAAAGPLLVTLCV